MVLFKEAEGGLVLVLLKASFRLTSATCTDIYETTTYLTVGIRTIHADCFVSRCLNVRCQAKANQPTPMVRTQGHLEIMFRVPSITLQALLDSSVTDVLHSGLGGAVAGRGPVRASSGL